MKYQHVQLAQGRWYKMSLVEQMANIGSEIERAISWQDRNKEYSQRASFRAIELLELSLSDSKRTYAQLKELSRIKELWMDFFYLDNEFFSPPEFFKKYFYAFAYAARLRQIRSNSPE